MKFKIDEVDFTDKDFDKIFETSFEKETPLLIRNVQCFDEEKITPEFVKKHFLNEQRRQVGWYDAEIPTEDIIQTPAFIRQLMERSDVSTRAAPTRIFMQKKGHKTLPHYDGNSLHGLNLQIRGKKKWIITSPDTPLPLAPFLFVGAVTQNFGMDEAKYDYCEFYTQPGDLLSLPRQYFHEVHSLGEVNINFNWVVTPVMPNDSTHLGRRESEIVKLRKSIPFINKIYPDNFADYGGSGAPLIENYTKDVGLTRMFSRLVKEISAIPRFLLVARQVKKEADRFSKNNFNVE